VVTVATAGEVIGAAVPAPAFGRSTAGEWTAARVGFTLVGVTTPVSTALLVEDISIDDLRPDHANPRLIGDDELDALERSLRQFGFVQPSSPGGRTPRSSVATSVWSLLADWASRPSR
jgi:hypothetical protein